MPVGSLCEKQTGRKGRVMAESVGHVLTAFANLSLFHSARKIVVLLLENNMQGAVQRWGQCNALP